MKMGCEIKISHQILLQSCNTTLKKAPPCIYTGEPIYFYMIGRNAGPNQVLVNENYQL